MSATRPALLRAQPATRHTVAGLAVLELRRFVVNPLFLLAAAFSTLIWLLPSAPVVEINEANPYTAIILGGFSMTAMFWQTRSLRPTAQVVDTTPASLQVRTAALCAVALVPLLVGVTSAVVFRHNVSVAGDWVYGAFDPSTRTAVLASQFVLPSLGGPLLGVALGRWVPLPGAGFLLLVLLYGWVSLVTIATMSRPDDTEAVVLRFLAPFAFFTLHDGAGGTVTVTTWRGSPWFFLGWQVCLCAVAVLVGLLRGAEAAVRRRLLRALAAVVVVAVLLLVLTVQGGFPHSVTTP